MASLQNFALASKGNRRSTFKAQSARLMCAGPGNCTLPGASWYLQCPPFAHTVLRRFMPLRNSMCDDGLGLEGSPRSTGRSLDMPVFPYFDRENARRAPRRGTRSELLRTIPLLHAKFPAYC